MDTKNESEELDPITFAHICSLLDSGDEHIEKGEYELAIDLFERALSLLPEPIYEWQISTNLLTAIGETYLFKRDYENARRYLSDVQKQCPNGWGNLAT